MCDEGYLQNPLGVYNYFNDSEEMNMKFNVKKVPEYRHPSGLIFREVWVLSQDGRDILVSADVADIDAAMAAGSVA